MQVQTGNAQRENGYVRIWELRAERDRATSLREFAEITREIDEETSRLGAKRASEAMDCVERWKIGGGAIPV